MIYSAAVTFALFLTQAARALPQGPPSGDSSSDSSDNWSPATYTTSTYYSSTPSPYGTTDHYPKNTPYASSPYSSSPYSSSPYSSSPYSSSPYPSSPYSSSPYSSSPYPSSPYPSSPYSSSPYPTTTPYYSSNPSPYSSPYSSTYGYPKNTPYYSPSSPYPTTDHYTKSMDGYPKNTPYYSSPPPKQTYPPSTTPPYAPPSKPDEGKPKPGTPQPPSPLRATFDTTFDNKAGSMNGVACSDGQNGLAARFPTFGDVPSFPFIGGAFDVVWNSPNCGSCWSVTNKATGVSVNITAIDTAGAGFNIAQEAFVQLNGGSIGQGVLDVVANKISTSACGL